MSSINHIVAVNVGAGSIKVGEFHVPKAGMLTLQRYGVAELGGDVQAGETAVMNTVPAVLKKLMADCGIKPQKAFVALSGQSSFMRFVKLPPVEIGQVEQVVTYEAQQNIPFPLEEVVWDYQFIPPRAGGSDIEAVIAAMKSDVLEADVAGIQSAGLSVELVDMSALALYNAYMFNYEVSEDCVLLIDVGARTTNLLFIEKQFLTTRSVPIAGNLISQNIANDLHEPLHVVDYLKKTKGFVGLGAAYADSDDPQAARISKSIRGTMARLHQEINRSISFYRTQSRGLPPQKVLLAGGSTLLPFFDILLQEKLNLPVEYFNPLRNVTIAPTVNSAGISHSAVMLGEVVGVATRALANTPVEINLAPPSVKDRQASRRRQPYLILALFVWAAVMLCVAGYEWRQVQIVNMAREKFESKSKELDEKNKRIIPLEKQYDMLNRALTSAEHILDQRQAWPAILDLMNQEIPVGIWITQFDATYGGKSLDDEVVVPKVAGKKPTKPDPKAKPRKDDKAADMPMRTAPEVNKLVIKGLYETIPDNHRVDVQEFVKKLSKSEWFNLPDDQAVNKAVTSIESDSPQGDKQPLALSFNIALELKKTVDLKP